MERSLVLPDLCDVTVMRDAGLSEAVQTVVAVCAYPRSLDRALTGRVR